MAHSEIEHTSNAPQLDDLDALFEHDHAMDDIFAEIRGGTNAASNNTREPKDVTYGYKRSNEGEDDEKIKITKKRAPVAKLDEARLVSDGGIAKLQRISKTRLKFKGKGHEFSDVAQLLRTYQLWLDDLYPRAKFSDGLTMIEKLGHSKRMQLRRKAWIDEGKPTRSTEEDDDEPERFLPATTEVPPDSESTEEVDGKVTPLPLVRSHEDPSSARGGTYDGDELARPHSTRSSQDGPDELDDDDLDALLAEESAGLNNEYVRASHRNGDGQHNTTGPSFDDDEDAMREMEGF